MKPQTRFDSDPRLQTFQSDHLNSGRNLALSSRIPVLDVSRTLLVGSGLPSRLVKFLAHFPAVDGMAFRLDQTAWESMQRKWKRKNEQTEQRIGDG